MRIKPLAALLFWIWEFDDVTCTHSIVIRRLNSAGTMSSFILQLKLRNLFVFDKWCTQHFMLRNCLYCHRKQASCNKIPCSSLTKKKERNNQMWFTFHFSKINSAWLIGPQQNIKQLSERNVEKKEELFLKRILPYFPKLNVTLSPISTKGAHCFKSE